MSCLAAYMSRIVVTLASISAIVATNTLPIVCGQDFAALVRYVPEGANAALFIDANVLKASQLAREQHWFDSRNENGHPFYIPADAQNIIVASRVDPTARLTPQWDVALIRLSTPFDVRSAADAEGGYPAPEPTIPPAEDVFISPALSQIGGTWPTDGRKIGIIADETSDLDGVRELRQAIDAAGMVPLVIGPHGGMLGGGSGTPFPVQRSFLTARSVEFDAVLVAGAPAPAPDATPAYDAKAASGEAHTDPSLAPIDPRMTMLVAEAYRHSKAIGAWGDGAAVLAQAGAGGAGVVVADSPAAALEEVRELLSRHRVWDRFPVLS